MHAVCRSARVGARTRSFGAGSRRRTAELVRARKNEKKLGGAGGVHRRARVRARNVSNRPESVRASEATLPEFSFSRVPYRAARPFVAAATRERPKRRIM